MHKRFSGHGGSAYGCVIISPHAPRGKGDAGGAMLEGRCWRSDAGGLRLQQWHQSHHGISAPMHQGASICKQRRAAVLTFRGGCSGCCSWIRWSYLVFIIGVISSQPSPADAPSRRAAENEQEQENDEGLGGTLAGGTLAHST